MERTKLIKQLRQRGGVNVADSDQAYTYMVEPLSPELEHAGETAEEQAWASKRIVLAGFSQGAVLSLVTGLTAENDLAGLVILSGYMPIKARLQQISQDMGRESMPVFWGHGMKDNVLLYVLSSPYFLPPSFVSSLTLFSEFQAFRSRDFHRDPPRATSTGSRDDEHRFPNVRGRRTRDLVQRRRVGD